MLKSRQAATALAVLFFLGILATTFSSLSQNSMPPLEQVKAETLQTLNDSLDGTAEITITAVEMADGWSGGTEIEVTFDLAPKSDATLASGLIGGLVMRKGVDLAGGRLSLSHSLQTDETWKLLDISIISLPRAR